MAMAGMTVCFTNISKEDRDVLIRQTQQMGGEVHTDMSTEVGYLVVGETQSKKYIVASERGIRCVTADWVTHLWNQSVKQLKDKGITTLFSQNTTSKKFFFSRSRGFLTLSKSSLFKTVLIEPCEPASQSSEYETIYNTYRCPPFHGLTLCTSNLETDEKTKLSSLITQHGGRYLPALERNSVTHLVLGSPGGKKHKYAKRWGFTIVTAKWVTDSVKAGWAQQASDYAVDSHEFSSSSEATTNEGIIEETKVLQQTAMGAPPPPPNYIAELERQLQQAQKSAFDSDLFEECRFFLSGYSERHQKQIKAILAKGGGYVFDTLSHSITHILLSRVEAQNSNPDVRKYQQTNGPKPFVVDFSWIHEAVVDNAMHDEGDFLVLDQNTGAITNPAVAEKTRKGSSSTSAASKLPDHSSFNTLSVTESNLDDFTDDNVTAMGNTIRMEPNRDDEIEFKTPNVRKRKSQEHADDEDQPTPEAETPTGSARKRMYDQLLADFHSGALDTPVTEKTSKCPSTDEIGRLLDKHIAETSEENLRRKEIAPFSKSEKKRQEKLMSTKTPKKEGGLSVRLFNTKKQLANEFDDTEHEESLSEEKAPKSDFGGSVDETANEGTNGFDTSLGFKENQDPNETDFATRLKRLDQKKLERELRRKSAAQDSPRVVTPKEVRLRRRTLTEDPKHLEPVTSVIEFADTLDEDVTEIIEENEEETKHVFLLTSIDVADKKRLKQEIESLGGTVSESAGDQVTIAIAGSLQRNEKTLIALASGRPILPKDYIAQSISAKKWIKPEDYELKIDQFTVGKSNNAKMETQNIFNAIMKWKIHFKQENQRPFETWKVILIEAKKNDMRQFANILSSGGADIIYRSVANEVDLLEDEATHIIVNQRLKNDQHVMALFPRFKEIGAKVHTEMVISIALVDANPNKTINLPKALLSTYENFIQ